ncbi:MAG: hypothetical protein ACHP84_08515 [Caulobacterales bacterium]
MRWGRTSALIALAAAGLAACGKPAPSPATVAKPPQAAAPPAAPVALTPKQALAAAFAAAFPAGARETQANGDYVLTYSPLKLIALDKAGDRVALISGGEGQGMQGTCHACTGNLRITYLVRTGAGFAPTRPPVVQDTGGDGFGGLPQWKLIRADRFPALRIVTGYTAQGCTTEDVTVFLLQPNEINADERLGKHDDACI